MKQEHREIKENNRLKRQNYHTVHGDKDNKLFFKDFTLEEFMDGLCLNPITEELKFMKYTIKKK